MSGDMSNAELGVAEVDAKGAEGRLASSNGLAAQHQWSQDRMNEKTLAYMAGLCVVILGVVWAVDISVAIKYAILCAVAVVILYTVYRRRLAKSRLKELRDSQVKAHAGIN